MTLSAHFFIALLLVALGGGAGSMLRFLLDRWIQRKTVTPGKPAFPWGIVVVNVTGSLALGVLVGLIGAAPGSLVDPAAVATATSAGTAANALWLAFGTGLLGGYTTMSTASVDTVKLVRAGRRAAVLGHLLGTLGIAAACATGGVMLGMAL